MIDSMLEVLWLPLLAGLVLTGIHVYLGLHVLSRGVIFVDLALAQVAALGMTVAFLQGHGLQSPAASWYALAFTLVGAALLSLTRVRRAPIPQEAIIGVVYVVSAAATILVVDRVPQGGEQIKQLLVGSLLTVSLGDVLGLALLYSAIGGLHWLVRGPLLEISLGGGRGRSSLRLAAWDLLFYASFGIVVTSSVRVAGVLLVFSYLIVPAAAGVLLARSTRARLLVGWALGAAVTGAGLALSYVLDLPTGAAVVVTSGAMLGLLVAGIALGTLARMVRRQGFQVLWGAGVAAGALVAILGLLLVLFPAMDHPWLDGLEWAVPAIRIAFLSPAEQATHIEAVRDVAEGQQQVASLRALAQDARWGREPLDAEREERVRQFATSRAEITAGDRMVLDTLRVRARERQRYALGAPLLALGLASALALLWTRMRRRRPMPTEATAGGSA